MFKLVSVVTISVLLKSILPSPGWGMGNPTPTPAPAPEATGTTGKVVPEGMTTLLEAPAAPDVVVLAAVPPVEAEGLSAPDPGLVGLNEVDCVCKGLVVVGRLRVVGMASWSRHLTSSALARS